MIDVIMPTYNRAQALRKTIDSYMSQGGLGLFILLDDCSSDDTPTFAKELAERYPGKIVYHRETKKTTTPYLRNVGLKLSQSEHIFMGEDDVYLPSHHFKILLEKMNEHDADLIAGRRIDCTLDQTPEEAKRLADMDRDPIFIRVPFEGYFERYVDTAREVYALHSNALIKRSVFDAVQYDPAYDGNAFREETDFYIRAYDAGFHLWLIPDTLSYHLRNTTVNNSGGSRKKRIVYEYQVWKNTLRFFIKNKSIFKRRFGVQNIYWFALKCLVARYTYAAKRRIQWKLQK